MAALDGVVTQLEEKASEMDRRHITRALARHRREKKQRADGGEASTSRRLDRVEAWVERTEQQREEATPRRLAGTPSLQPLAAIEDIGFGGLTEQEYLDTYFPDLIDLPCRLLLGIMEYVYRHRLKKLYNEPSGGPSAWRGHIKGAIEAIVNRRFIQPKRDTMGFKILAKTLAVRSHDEMQPLDPSKLIALRASVDDNVDDSLKRACNTLVNALGHFRDIPEVLPPLHRVVIEELEKGGCLCDEDGDWNIDFGVTTSKLVQLVRRGADAYEVCDVLKAEEVKEYVKDRLDGASSKNALEAVLEDREASGGRQKKRARRTR